MESDGKMWMYVRQYQSERQVSQVDHNNVSCTHDIFCSIHARTKNWIIVLCGVDTSQTYAY
jgi:hypothetical protein